MYTNFFLTASLLFILGTHNSYSEEVSVSPESPITFTSQLRTRSTYSKVGFMDTDPGVKNELRTRIGASMTPSEKVMLMVEFQDSRNFGSEPQGASLQGADHTSTIGNSSNVDLHQAYFSLNFGKTILAMGRQKLAFGSQRYISSLEWHPNARVFDGLVLKIPAGPGSITALVAQPADSGGVLLDNKLTLAGAHLNYPISELATVEMTAFVDHSGAGLNDYTLTTLGARASGNLKPLFYDLEMLYQFGPFAGGDKSALYLASRLGTAIQKVKASLGLDIMSGGKAAKGESTYMANYYFAHAYFGWMDKFIVNPSQGVMDYRLDITIPAGSKVKVLSQNHYFAKSATPGEDPYGIELDLELHLSLFPKSKIVLGAGIFLPDTGFETAANPDPETDYTVYIMPIFNF